MKKNVYGNIEDLIISCRMVTSVGVLEQKFPVPRLSCGPDVNEMTIGSEGNCTTNLNRLIPVANYLFQSELLLRLSSRLSDCPNARYYSGYYFNARDLVYV